MDVFQRKKCLAPSGAEARIFSAVLSGTAEAEPFPKPVLGRQFLPQATTGTNL